MLKKELSSVDKYKALEIGFDKKDKKSLINEAFLLLDFTSNNI
jgi:hypothetical protein